MKKVYLLSALAAVAMVFTSCSNEKDEVRDLQQQIDNLSGTAGNNQRNITKNTEAIASLKLDIAASVAGLEAADSLTNEALALAIAEVNAQLELGLLAINGNIELSVLTALQLGELAELVNESLAVFAGASATYDAETGIVTIIFGDQVFMTGDLRGADGIDGTNGVIGADGRDGLGGADATPDTEAPVIVSLSSNASVTGEYVVGVEYTFAAVVTDNRRVNAVKYHRNGGINNVSSNVIMWDNAGEKSVHVIALDAAGNKSERTFDIVVLAEASVVTPTDSPDGLGEDGTDLGDGGESTLGDDAEWTTSTVSLELYGVVYTTLYSNADFDMDFVIDIDALSGGQVSYQLVDSSLSGDARAIGDLVPADSVDAAITAAKAAIALL